MVIKHAKRRKKNVIHDNHRRRHRNRLVEMDKWTSTSSNHTLYKKNVDHLFSYVPNNESGPQFSSKSCVNFRAFFIFDHFTCLTIHLSNDIKKKDIFWISKKNEKYSNVFFNWLTIVLQHNIYFRLTVSWCTSQMIAHTVQIFSFKLRRSLIDSTDLLVFLFRNTRYTKKKTATTLQQHTDVLESLFFYCCCYCATRYVVHTLAT